MPPIAICSADGCDFRIKLQDNKAGTSTTTPEKCPKCGAAIISKCPWCGFLLLGNPDSARPVCAVCCTEIRKVFAVRRARAASA
jgi:rRNA maturation protein Nop10